MKDIILIVITVWTISVFIVRKQIFNEETPLLVIYLRLIFAPLILVFELVKWIVLGIGPTLRKN